MKKNEITIGTRKSRLALIQTEYIKGLLEARHPGIVVNVKHIVTKGDKILDVPLARIGDKGLFTKELETALLEREADIAVHSYKDLPTKLPDGLAVGAVLERVPNEDVLISKPGTTIGNLPPGAKIGTSSLRRKSQLLRIRTDLDILDLRGNVNTRIDKFLNGTFDALLLARAGVMRMGLTEHIAQIIPLETMLPAVGQGALAIEIREGDDEVQSLLSFMEHPPTRAATDAERAFLACLEGGCQVPIGAAGIPKDGNIELHGLVVSLDGSLYFRGVETADMNNAAQAGKILAGRLLSQGADVVLAEIRQAQAELEQQTKRTQ